MPAARTSSASPACRAAASRRWSRSSPRQCAQAGARSAIVAIDPSSPFSGGAILGDRIRMGDLAGDPGRVRPQHGDARRAGRPRARHARSRRRARRRRLRLSSSSRPSASARTRSTSRAPRTRRSSCRRPASATTSRRSRPASSRSPTSTSSASATSPTRDRTIADLKNDARAGRRACGTREPRWRPPVVATSSLQRRRRRRARSPRSTRHRQHLDDQRRRSRAPHGDRRAPAAEGRRGDPARPRSRGSATAASPTARGQLGRAQHRPRTPRRERAARRTSHGRNRRHEREHATAPRHRRSQREVEDVGAERGRGVPRARAGAAARSSARCGGFPLKRVYTALDVADTPLEDIGLPGQYPFTRGPVPDDVPRPDLDDAPDRRLRHRRGHQQALQVPDRAGPDRPVDRLRHADADGLRQRPSDERGRGRPRGRRDRHARRHGAPLRRHRPREDLGVDDDQPERVDPARDVHRARAEARLRPEQAVGHDPGRHPEGVPGAEGVDLPDRAVGAHRARLHHVLRAQHEALQPDQHLGLPHLGGRLARRSTRSRSRCATSSPTSRRSTKTGMHVDEFAPRLAFFYVCQADFFEEIAKFRAVRRVYAKIMRERFGAKNPESMRLRFHCQTAAAIAHQAAIPDQRRAHRPCRRSSAVLGGAQSLHTNGMDEAFAIPTEEAMKIALRTQQIIADETGVADVVDPLGGSYFVESLTTRLRARDLRDHRRGRQPRRHDQAHRGGLVPAADRRFRVRDGAQARRTARSR